MTPDSIKVKQGQAQTLDLHLELQLQRGEREHLIFTGKASRPLVSSSLQPDDTDGGRGEEGQGHTGDSQMELGERGGGRKSPLPVSLKIIQSCVRSAYMDNR
jgi:hypothetical protein